MKKIIQKYKNLIKIKRKILKYKILFYLNSRRKEIEAAFLEQEKRGLKTIPIFILSFNRLYYLKTLIKYLEENDYTNIYIIDNKSTYPPFN